MDLVKIGFQINANGLKDANTEVDKLLGKVDNIGTKGKKASSEFESSQKKVQDSVKKTEKVSTSASDKMIQKQQTINQLLPYMDKGVANLASSFWLVSKEAQSFNKFLDIMGEQDAIVKQKKQTEALVKEQEKQAKAVQSTIAQYEGLSNKSLGGGILDQIEQQNKGIEELRTKYQAEAKEADKKAESVIKAQEKQAKAVQDTVAQYENLSNKPLGNGVLDQIEQQNKGLEELKKQYQDQEKEAKKKADADQKILDDAEKERQKHFSKVQKDYEKQQQAIVDAQQKAIDKQVASQKALNDANQKAITLEQAKAKYVSQGYGKTDSTRLARLEVSGADVTTLNNYKSAIEATTRATQALNPAVEKVTTSHSNFLGQVKGIAIYAALSAAIYGVMTAMTSLAVSTVKMADEYTAIQNRMKLYITDAKELGKVNNQLAQFSMQNNVGLRETASLFSRLAPSMQKIGANTAAITSVVDAFGKSMRIGGATAMEAASATVQFSQAMASGKLAGDEFRSISEASPRFLQAIAEGSGIAADKLKEMSAAGMLTTEVISKALLNEYPKLIEENKKLGITLEQGANAIKTGFLVAIGEFNEGAKITEALGESMANLAQSMFTAAQGARQFGADVKKWFEENANTIQTVVEVIKLLAVTIVSKYVASMIVAGAISLKTAYSLHVAGIGATAAQRAFGLATISAIRLGSALSALATPKNLFTLGLTVAAVAASYLLMRDNTAEATQKLVEQSEYVDITTEAYQRLNKEQQLNARSSVVNDMNDVNKKLDEQAAAVERVLKSYAMSRQFSGLGLDKGTKEIINGVTKGVLSYDTALRMLSENKNIPKNIVDDFKKERDVYNETAKNATKFADAAKVVGDNTELAGNKAQNATPLIKGFSDQTSELGDKVEIASGKVRQFYQDLQAGTQKNILAFDLSNKLNISPSTGNKVAEELSNRATQEEGLKNKELITQQNEMIKLRAELLSQTAEFTKGAKSKAEVDQLKANTAEYLKQQHIYDNMRKSKPYVKVNPLSLLTPEETKIIKDYDASTSLSSNQTKKADDKDLKKFKVQALEAQTYYDVLQKVNNLDIARIASQKEYINIYKDNLDVATELANIQEMTRQAESRIGFEKSLREEEDSYTRIAALIKSGADYETAKAVANAKFTDDLRGREAAELSITNALIGQAYALSDQINDQETLNQYLKEGLGIEEARFKVALSRIAKLSGGKNVFGEFGEDFENAMKSLRVKRATEASQVKINSLNREAALLTTSMAFSYTAASLAAAKLSASTQGLLYSQAEIQLTKQNEVDLLTEQYEISLKISSLLSQDSEVMRDIKSQHPTILGVDAQRLETARKLLDITEAYSAKQQEQKKNPFGDFSNVNFDVFGDFGNPFKEALDGLNAFVSGSGQLDESLALVAAKIEDLKTQSFVEGMFGNQTAVKNITKEIEKQKALEKGLQTQKAKTIDIAYGQGLKFAKAFFKENSKGYKALTTLEQVQQGIRIALAIEEAAMKIGLVETTTLATMAANAKQQISEGVTAAVSSMKGLPFPYNIAAMGATIAAIAGLGVAIGGGFDSSSGTVTPANDGTGTVFGDSEAKSASIANSIDLLSENSDLMLPLTSAMLRSLRNIESSIGGVTNLILRGELGGDFSNLEFDGMFTGTLGKLDGIINSVEGFVDKISIGKMLGFNIREVVSGLGSTIIGGLFGKTSQKVMASGLYAGSQSLGSVLDTGLNLQQYADVATTKKSWFSKSTTNSTQYASASKELENQFGLIFTGFYDSIVSASGALSANTEEVKKKLQDAIINIGKIDLKGLKGEEIQEKLEAVFGAAADSLAQQGFAGLDDFQKVGEGYYETLVRVASSVEQASYYTEKLNVQAIKYTDILNKQGDVAAEIVRQSVLLNESTKDIKGGLYELVNNFEGTAEELTDFVLTLRDLQDQLFMTGKNADYLTSAMILGAGGLDKLSSGFDAYFEMLSPAEQAAELTRRLTNEFAIFGKELPSDVKAFRNLVSSIDITTGAGQKLYGQILALAPEFNDLQDALESTNSEVNALVQSLRDLAEQARAARGETEQPRNLAFLRNEFESASILAMQGDTEAANRLLTLGKDLMQVSKLYALSGSEYAKDLALIQRAATVSADVQENGLGTSISPTLTPSNATNTTPTVETTNTSTDTKLEAIREEFNAGLFAIAKYTQDMASRFERWDDGSRMLVGVQPENGDTPVPVAVVP